MAVMSGTNKGVGEDNRTIQAIWDAYGLAREQEARARVEAKADGGSTDECDEATARLATARNHLVMRYLELVKACATRLGSKLPTEIEVDDLIMEGVFGLIDAIDLFDPSRGIKFTTFAPKRIRGSMLDYLRSIDRAPRLVRTRAKKLNQAILSHQMRFGRPPTRQELANILHVSQTELDRIISDGNVVRTTSLDREVTSGTRESQTKFSHLIEDDKATDPLDVAHRRSLKEFITKRLTTAERLIMLLYYYEQMTMKEIGLTLDLSESRVSQMHTSIKARLKASLADREKELIGNP